MEAMFVLAFGVMVTTAIYLILSRNVLRIVLGMMVFSNAINLSIFICGRMGVMQPPVLADGGAATGDMANPLPQALILTAIVISFALTAFLVVLIERGYRLLGTVDTEQMRVVEPVRVRTHTPKNPPSEGAA